jgi:uncharacterized protein with von Willebrand factor type A (vWA) domain
MTSIVDRTVRLGHALQAAGVNVSLAEIIDATTAAAEIDLLVRSELREALRATLVKDARHHALFDREFDHCFPARPHRTADDRGGDPVDLVAAIASGQGLADAAAALVDEFAGLDGETRSEKHHAQRVFHGADIARLMSRVRIADPSVTPDQLRARIDELKRLVAADIRGQIDVPDPGIAPDIQDVDFLEASRAELDQMRRAIRPIARKLAARLARKRQHRSGRVNFRRTVRRSLGTGGVPLDVAHDRPRAHRPELIVLCDISGSVADFSLFTLTLVAALSAEVSRTRTFVFVDAVDEITELLASTDHLIEPWQLMRNTNVIRDDGHSDYGRVFEQFWHDFAERDLGRNSTVIITGDARTNYRGNGAEWLARVGDRARRVYWLNPEPVAEWNTYDSEIGTYSRHCRSVHEVRTLRQLVACVEELF